ncbi:hypothetical protein [Indioceanicola profundi]|uniref:hypothetical protein n=1 Tax=Indioceanicola profundi TaxID=2220096 RepID=UPI000E6AC7B1|nr:hypothetical protein [Indioceanicola profundi]
MTSLLRTIVCGVALSPLLALGPLADPETNVQPPIPPAEQVKIAYLDGYEPVISNLERLQNNFALGTGEVVTNVEPE